MTCVAPEGAQDHNLTVTHRFRGGLSSFVPPEAGLPIFALTDTVARVAVCETLAGTSIAPKKARDNERYRNVMAFRCLVYGWVNTVW